MITRQAAPLLRHAPAQPLPKRDTQPLQALAWLQPAKGEERARVQSIARLIKLAGELVQCARRGNGCRVQ